MLTRILLACMVLLGSATGARAAAEHGVTDDTIVIGSHGPLTGNASFVGLGSRAGMEVAIQKVNDAGGINGRKLRVVFNTPFSDSYLRLGDVSINLQYLWVTFCALAIMGLRALFFRNNMLGKAMRAVAQDQEAARLMGIRVSRVFPAIFALSAATAALAGILIAPINGIEPEMGNVLMKGFVAAVVGGFDSLAGCVIAGFLLGTLESFGGAYVGGVFKDVSAFVLLTMLLLVRPYGFFGRAESRRV